jgi:hypothetical protein
MNLKAILSAFLIIFSCSVCESAAKTKVKYPPYPDVWGYDILDDVDTSDIVSLHIGKMTDDDYTIFYSDKDGTSYNIINVFKGEKKRFSSWEELDKYLDSRGGRFHPGSAPYASLSDGKVIDINSKLLGSSIYCLCVRRTTDDFKTENNEYELSAIGIAPHCKEGKGCVNRAYFLAQELIELKDDTFFAFDPHYYLFIRFDRDFKTKFKPQHTVKLDGNRELKSNFYVLPYSKIAYFFEHVAVGYTGEYPESDDIHRQFLDYLYEEEQRGSLYVTP